MGQSEVFRKGLELFLGPRQYVQRHMQDRHITVLQGQTDVGLRAWFIAVLSFQSCWQCRFVHLTNGRQVIVANPVPQTQLLFGDDGCLVHDLLNGLHRITLRFCRMNTTYQSDIRLRTSEGHQHTNTYLHRHAFRHGVSKHPMQGNRQNHINIRHTGGKDTKK